MPNCCLSVYSASVFGITLLEFLLYFVLQKSEHSSKGFRCWVASEPQRLGRMSDKKKLDCVLECLETARSGHPRLREQCLLLVYLLTAELLER